jgi:hypothetical protein
MATATFTKMLKTDQQVMWHPESQSETFSSSCSNIVFHHILREL